MSRPRLSPLLLAACLAPSPSLHAHVLGVFTDQCLVPSGRATSSAHYDSHAQAYTLSAASPSDAGAPFVYRRLRGDVVLQALLAFEPSAQPTQGAAGLHLRASLAEESPYVSLLVRTDGTTTAEVRRQTHGPIEQLTLPSAQVAALQLSREQGHLRVSAAPFGDLYTEHELAGVELGDEVWVGLVLQPGAQPTSATAVLRNVRLVRPAPPGFAPYRDYIGSHLELLDPATGHRRAIHWVDDSLQAPNWTPDNRALIYNHNGRIGRFDLATGTTRLIDTGNVIENNNDHALSFDGRFLGLSSGQPSRVYTVPVDGGTPKLITPEGPSYLHGWSPDGQTLIFTGGRNGNYDIYAVPSAGGPERRLTHTDSLEDGSEYTPDGQHILFISNRTGTMQLWRMRPDGSEPTPLTHDALNNWFPHPSPDGKSLLFLSYRPDVPSAEHPFYRHVYLRQMPLNGGEPRVVAYFYGGQGSINVNSWSPDSRLAAFVSNSQPLEP